MDFILLVIVIIILFISIIKMTVLEKLKTKSTTEEIKQNVTFIFWGIPIIFALVFIPYQVWALTGKLNDWGGVYILGGTALLTIIITFTLYYTRKIKLNF
ncbi:hypothetical protein [Litchfieldia alkalitelluris]|uniref:hypothetical protein n=1 Tax=Litchfieldia alkalitelluris TaxID=304268 RepID=UPI00099874F0|nr:hypothetical protein [Litchfieldia alkalitelluris]